MPTNSLNTILGLRNNVAIFVREHIGDLDVIVGAAYYANKNIISLDGLSLRLSTDVEEFHWKANVLEIYLTVDLHTLLNKES